MVYEATTGSPKILRNWVPNRFLSHIDRRKMCEDHDRENGKENEDLLEGSNEIKIEYYT